MLPSSAPSRSLHCSPTLVTCPPTHFFTWHSFKLHLDLKPITTHFSSTVHGQGKDHWKVSLFSYTDVACCHPNWRLFCGDSWTILLDISFHRHEQGVSVMQILGHNKDCIHWPYQWSFFIYKKYHLYALSYGAHTEMVSKWTKTVTRNQSCSRLRVPALLSILCVNKRYIQLFDKTCTVAWQKCNFLVKLTLYTAAFEIFHGVW